MSICVQCTFCGNESCVILQFRIAIGKELWQKAYNYKGKHINRVQARKCSQVNFISTEQLDYRIIGASLS